MVIGNKSRRNSDVKAAYNTFEPSTFEGKIYIIKYFKNYLKILLPYISLKISKCKKMYYV